VFDGLDDELSDPIASADLEVRLRIGVDEEHLDLASIARIDEPGCVQACDAVSHRQTAPRLDESGVAARQGDHQPGRHERTAPSRTEHGVNSGDEIATGITISCVGRSLKPIVQDADGHVEHESRVLPCRSAGSGAWLRSGPVLAWIDLEMTGLDPSRHVIVEIASVVTDDELTVIAEGPDLVVGASEAQLSEMDDFVTEMHDRSGLLDEIHRSSLQIEDAQAATLAFLRTHIELPSSVPLAGNSIGTDRRFLAAQMPEVENFLHYRCVDVSTIKELCRRWYPDLSAAAPAKVGSHRALGDILESIAELRHYRETIFRAEGP